MSEIVDNVLERLVVEKKNGKVVRFSSYKFQLTGDDADAVAKAYVKALKVTAPKPKKKLVEVEEDEDEDDESDE